MTLSRHLAARPFLSIKSLPVLCAICWRFASGNIAAAESVGYTVKLDYRETSEALVVRAVRAELASAPFNKEPALPKQEVVRGLLRWGIASEKPISFIWNQTGRMLHLDLNRNQDLTDDTNGVFSGITNSYSQVFTNISLSCVTAAGTHPVLVRLEFRRYGGNGLSVTAGLCSYWQAKATFGGQDWQFGILENVLDARNTVSRQYLLWRPWAERDYAFNLLTSSGDFADYSTNLFLAGQRYVLDCRYESKDATPHYRATLTPRSATLGELRLTGSSVHRLFLKGDDGLIAVLDKPEGIVRVPAGSYSVEEIWLRSKGIEVARFRAGRLKVPAGGIASLKAGAPLTNSVSIQSSGHNLVLTYKLLGVDGTEYHFPRRKNERPPEFVIFEGTNRLATGKFAYG
jgi:hypothetical protein